MVRLFLSAEETERLVWVWLRRGGWCADGHCLDHFYFCGVFKDVPELVPQSETHQAEQEQVRQQTFSGFRRDDIFLLPRCFRLHSRQPPPPTAMATAPRKRPFVRLQHEHPDEEDDGAAAVVGAVIVSESQLTPFARRVYALTRRIPAGSVSTYGDLAKMLTGSSRSARAVGSALRRNPFAPFVPCHRVIRGECQVLLALVGLLSRLRPDLWVGGLARFDPLRRLSFHLLAGDLKLGGFSGVTDPKSEHVCRKASLLASEGVEFVADPGRDGLRLADPKRALVSWAGTAKGLAEFSPEELSDEALSASPDQEPTKPPLLEPLLAQPKDE